MKPFVKGDIDGFFALGLDSLVCLLFMTGFCLGLLGFSNELYFGRILPGTAVGLVLGNLYYARQALRLAKAEGRQDVCALPYGINLITIVTFSLLVMLPTQQAALASGMAKDAADLIAWHAGILACIGSGLIEFLGSFIIERVRRITPRAALLSTLAGIGILFLAMDFLYRTFAFPIVGFTTLALTLAIYFGRVNFRGGVPGGLVIIALGTALAWGTYFGNLASPVPAFPFSTEQLGLRLPIPALGEIVNNLPFLISYLGIIAPMGFINLLLSMQCIESAAAAGDSYRTRPSLAVNGAGSIVSGIFGSPYPTCIYIGHPGWKIIGARAGYSTLNAIFVSLVVFTGSLSLVAWLIPVEAGMAILIYIGIMMGNQAFGAVPKRHIPAVVVGMLPAIAAYVALMMKHAFWGAGYGLPDQPFSPELLDNIVASRGFFAEGVFALEQGYVFTCLVFGAATVAIIERKFYVAAGWFGAAALLTATGMIHAFQFLAGDIVSEFRAEWKWVVGYLVMAAIMLVMPWLTRPAPNDAAADI